MSILRPNSEDIELLTSNMGFLGTQYPWNIYLFLNSPLENQLLEHNTQGPILAKNFIYALSKPKMVQNPIFHENNSQNTLRAGFFCR